MILVDEARMELLEAVMHLGNMPETISDLRQRQAAVQSRSRARETAAATAQQREALAREALANARIDVELGVKEPSDLAPLKREHGEALHAREEAEAEIEANRRSVARLAELLSVAESKWKAEAAPVVLDLQRQAVMRVNDALEGVRITSEECHRIRQAIEDQFPPKPGSYAPFYIPGIPHDYFHWCDSWWAEFRCRKPNPKEFNFDNGAGPISRLEGWRLQLRRMGILPKE